MQLDGAHTRATDSLYKQIAVLEKQNEELRNLTAFLQVAIKNDIESDLLDYVVDLIVPDWLERYRKSKQ